MLNGKRMSFCSSCLSKLRCHIRHLTSSRSPLSEQPEYLYKKLGAKLAVGMPFKDIATSDTILMREIPPSSDTEGRRALRRLQEVTVHVIVPAAKLAADPLPGAVTLHTLREAVAAHKAGGVKLPQGSTRLAIEVDGTETDAEILALKQLSPVVVLLNTKDGLSRIHASRRVFELIKREGITTPVIHHIRFPASASRSAKEGEIIMRDLGYWPNFNQTLNLSQGRDCDQHWLLGRRPPGRRPGRRRTDRGSSRRP